MSQLGAYRWSRGNQCATGGGDDTSWPVRWDDYRQILAHYYTGIDMLNGSGAKIAPDDRWNLLNHTVPSTMTLGQSYNVLLFVQNTSTSLHLIGQEMYPWGGGGQRAAPDHDPDIKRNRKYDMFGKIKAGQ